MAPYQPILATAAAAVGDPALTVSLALVAGLVCQALAHHLRLPGIVLLLGAGALLGPDGLAVIRPGALNGTIHTLVGFAVAVVLFEGGLNLNLGRLRRESTSIRQFVTVGAAVTALGAALAARWILGWEWRMAALFGTLVIVTGPTVVTPLLRRIKLNRKLSTILEAEGVLIDPIGAIVAVVALEVAVQPAGTLASGIFGAAARLAVGVGLGLAGGGLLALLLRPRRLIPEGLENVFTLAAVLAMFHLSNGIQGESGIATVTVAGLIVGNTGSRALNDLKEFKEQLTVMLIGMLFVLLSADVRFDAVRRLGWPGVWTVVVLMVVVRPVNVAVSTLGSDLSFREKTVLAWLAPRGIVAAAVASFFAVALTDAGIPGGPALQAMVFLVIAMTVLLQGLTSGWLAGVLGLRRRTGIGYVILGANALGRALGRALRETEGEITFIDSNADAVQEAQEDGFRVIFGSAMEERTLGRAGVETAAGCVGLTPNEQVNLLFASRVNEGFRGPKLYVALERHETHVTPAMVDRENASVLFGAKRDTGLWTLRLRRGDARIERRRLAAAKGASEETPETSGEMEAAVLPLALHRKGRSLPVDEATRAREGDAMTFLVFEEGRERAEAWFATAGWSPSPSETPSARRS